MPRKKKFIDPKKKRTFVLVQRPISEQQDSNNEASHLFVPAYKPSNTKNYEQDYAEEEAMAELLNAPTVIPSEKSEADIIGAEEADKYNDEYVDDDDDDDDDIPGLEAKDGENEDIIQSDDELLLELPNDGYNYTQHITTGGGGTFVPATNVPDVIVDNDYTQDDFEQFDEDTKEVLRMLEDSDEELFPDSKQEEIEEMLADPVAGVGDLLDDFVLTANDNQLPDFHKYKKMLAKREILTASDAISNATSRYQRTGFFWDGYAMKEPYQKDRTIVYLNDEDQQFLNEQFEYIKQFYTDEEIGEVDADEQTDCRTLDEDILERFNGIFDEFLASKKGTKLSSALQEDQSELTVMDKIKQHAIAATNRPQTKADYEYVEIQARDDEMWDCESIISTYSNLENHPKIIDDVTPAKQIKLSKKTGMPLGVLPTKPTKKKQFEVEEEGEEDEDNMSTVSVNKGAARSKNETREEKRNRKKQLRQEKRQRIMEKKKLKNAFKTEEHKQKNAMAHSRIKNPSGIRF